MKLRQITLMYSSKEAESKGNQRCLAVGKIWKENKIRSKKKIKTLPFLEIFGIKQRTGFKDKNLCTFVSVLLKTKILNAANELENG